MKRKLLLFIFSLSVVFVSCSKNNSLHNAEPSLVIKNAQNKFIRLRLNIAEAMNSTSHLTMPLTSLETSLNVGASKIKLNYINKYIKYYLDYVSTRGKVTRILKPDHVRFEVDYGNGIIEYGGSKLKGKFIVDIKRNKNLITENRIWDLEIEGNKVNGKVTYKIVRENGKFVFEGQCEDFKIKMSDGEEITEKFIANEERAKNKLNVIEGRYLAKSSKGVDCSYTIERPLFYDLKYSAGLPIEGMEKVMIKEKNKEIKMMVDYGFGKRDLKVRVTYPNGKEEELDFTRRR